MCVIEDVFIVEAVLVVGGILAEECRTGSLVRE